MTHSRLDFVIDEAVQVVMRAKPHFTKRQAYVFLQEAVGNRNPMPDIPGLQIQDLRSGDTVTALVNGPIAVCGATYEVSEIRLRDGFIGLTLLKPNRGLKKEAWTSFDVSGNNLSDLFQVNNN